MDDLQRDKLESELNALDFSCEDDRFRLEEIVQQQLERLKSLSDEIAVFEKCSAGVQQNLEKLRSVVCEYNSTVDLILGIKKMLENKLCLNNDQWLIKYQQLKIDRDFSYTVSTL